MNQRNPVTPGNYPPRRERVPDPARKTSVYRGNGPRPKGAGKGLSAWKIVKRSLLTLFFLILLGLSAGLTLFLVLYSQTEIPKPAEFAKLQVTTVYYADGKTEIGKFAELNRSIVDTDELPKYVGQAVIASEDRSFWTNSGVDLRGIGRALVNNLRGGATQGASTLSQQYVENYYLGKNPATGNFFQRYWGKAKEAILALKINRQQSKEEILGNYLNTIYFGRSSYGIEAAAKAYFGISAKELDYSQAAMLAGIIPGPSIYDPAVNLDKSKSRWERVIKFMAEDGYISQQQAATATFPQTIEYSKRSNDLSGSRGHLLEQVRKELVAEAGIEEGQINTMGVKIITTIDKNKQDLMEKTVDALPDTHAPGLRVAMINIDPKTGAIVAEYPGEDYLKVQTNAVTQDRVQAGSTFKPFTLAAALEQGASLNDIYAAKSPTIFGGQPVVNFNNQSFPPVTLRKATALSLNVPYVALNREIGPKNTENMAVKLGIPKDTPGLNDGFLNVLGSASPHLVDLARAYGTVTNGGQQIKVHIIKQIVDQVGDVVYVPTLSTKTAIERDVAAKVLSAMQSVITEGIGKEANLGRPVAGKTGTSSDNRSALFLGAIPQSLTAVALYQVGENGSEESIKAFGGYREITGSTWPLRLWKNYMKPAVAKMEVEKFPTPPKATSTFVAPSEEPSETPEESQSPTPTDPASPGTQNPASPTPVPSASPADPASPGAATAPGTGPVNPGQSDGTNIPGTSITGENPASNGTNPAAPSQENPAASPRPAPVISVPPATEAQPVPSPAGGN